MTNGIGRLVGCAALAATVLGGCRAIGDLAGAPQVPVVIPFEVWNRTREDVFLIDADGRRLDVAACAHAATERFRVNDVRVRTDRGYVFGFGSAGDGPLGAGPQYLVLVAADGASFPATVRPTDLPPCRGRPNAQPGV